MVTSPKYIKAKTERALETKLAMMFARNSYKVISIQKVGEFWFCWYFGEINFEAELGKLKDGTADKLD